MLAELPMASAVEETAEPMDHALGLVAHLDQSRRYEGEHLSGMAEAESVSRRGDVLGFRRPIELQAELIAQPHTGRALTTEDSHRPKPDVLFCRRSGAGRVCLRQAPGVSCPHELPTQEPPATDRTLSWGLSGRSAFNSTSARRSRVSSRDRSLLVSLPGSTDVSGGLSRRD